MSTPELDDPRRSPFQAAHDVTGHLISVLTPLPTMIGITCYTFAPDRPEVRGNAHKDLAALHAWQAVVGGELTSEVRESGQIFWGLTTVVNGTPVELWTLLDAPVADGAE